MKKNSEKYNKIVSIRFSESQLAEIKEISSKLGLSEQDVFRLMLSIGIKLYSRIGKDFADIVLDFISQNKPLPKKQG